MWRRFVRVALLLGAVSAWTPQPRPSPIHQQQQKQKSLLSELTPWATAGFVAASIAFTPLPAQADTPPTGVRVDVETNSLIDSIKENKGELNTAISKIVKDTPSEAIKLDPPESKADAIRDALNVGKEKEASKETETAAVREEPKTETKVEEPQKEEPKVEKLAEAPAVEAKESKPAVVEEKKEASTPEVKAEAPAPVEQKAEAPSAPKVEALKEDSKKEEPSKVEPAAESPKEQAVMEAPKPVEVKKEEPKKEPVAEAAKSTVEQPNKQAEPATEKKLPTIVDMLREKMNKDAPPAVTSEKPEVPKQDIKPEASSDTAAPETPKEATSPEAPTVPSTPVTAVTPADKDVTNFDDVPFWQRPAIRTTVPSPDGSGDTKLVFNNREVATGSLIGVALSYLVTYPIFNYESEEEQRRAEENKKEMAAKRASAPKKETPGVKAAEQTTSEKPLPATKTAKKEDEPSTYTGPSYIDRLASTENSPPQQEVSLKKIAKKPVEEPQAKPASTLSTAANGSYLDALSSSKSTPVPPNPTSPSFRPTNEATGAKRGYYAKTANKPKPKAPKPKAPRGGGSYLDSL